MRRSHILLVGVFLVLVSAFTVFAGEPDSRNASDPVSPPIPGDSSDLEKQRIGAGPEISLHRTELDFGAVISGAHTGAQQFMVSNSGGGSLSWSGSASEPWIQLAPSTGTGDYTVPVEVGVDPSGLSAGSYAGTITISDPNATNSPLVVTVTLGVRESDTPPFGQFSTPMDQSYTNNVVSVTGWALDDVQVMSVKIYREENAALVYVGDAAFVKGARPDVQSVYPEYPNNDRAGWGYALNTHLLPDGGSAVLELHAIATDSTGRQVTLGTKTIINDNANAVKPFGSIDTPGQGEVASGRVYTISGWALTPEPNVIPTDGSTISVYVDGVNLGHPVYGVYREDIAALYVGYNNLSGAGIAYSLDTRTYANGVHTVQFVASDNVGNIDGIGSRYFTILNPPIAPVYGASLPLIMR